ncbi:uncharacterized protein LOC134239686 [Saccostrea cucullata]|uniref:uncharacterized protein LOC134239686 n=1 Tax=Saccostrea cuccullata TaxID=36930 RepID=UPI002ED4CFF5
MKVPLMFLLMPLCLALVITSCLGHVVEDNWELVFHAVKGNRQNVLAAWTNGTASPCTLDNGCINRGFTLDNWSNTTQHLRSPLINLWHLLNIIKVRVVFGAQGNTVAFLEFDGSGSNKENWFSKERLLRSSWSDLNSNSVTNYFSMNGYPHFYNDSGRHFFINKSYGSCPNDIGWLVVIDRIPVCTWEKKGDHPPLFLYSKSSKAMNWNTNIGSADVMNVYILTL